MSNFGGGSPKELSLSQDWDCLNNDTIDVACNTFTDRFMNFAKESIPTKKVTMRPSDKPKYDSEIRRHSRKRDRLKKRQQSPANRLIGPIINMNVTK